MIPTPSGRRVLPIAAELHAQPAQTLSLQALVPVPKPAIAWGVNQDILEHCLAEHEVAVFARDPTDYWPVDPKILHMWRQIPAWDPALPCDELYIFTDGSFFEHATNATWAVVFLAMQGKQIGRVGVRAGVAQGPSQHGDAHARQPSAFDGELEAIMHAMAVAAGTPCRNVHLGADCETAIATAQGQTETAAWDLVSRATVSLHALLTMQSKRLFFHKILAHAGCALNGMADSVAKAVGKAPEQGADAAFDNLWSAIVEKTADHLWMVPSHHVTTTSLPYLSDTGTWAQASCNIQLPLAMERPFSMPRPDTTECPVDIDLRVLQYNVLSLKAAGAMDLVARGLRRANIDIAGVQETRLHLRGITTQGDFWVLHAPCTDQGIGGAQLWIRQSSKWDRQAFTIIHQEPQILVALGSYQGLKLLLVSAHAPPAVSTAAALQEWWLHLATVLHRTPAACTPVMFLDANATFRKGPSTAETLQSEPICCNAQHLRDFARKQGLALSPQALPSGEPLYSWTSPQGHRKLIDYVGVPADWLAACEAQPSPSLGDLYEDIDHQPVLMRICTTACAAPLQHRNRIDTQLWATTDGARLAQGVTARCRPITWASCATDHVDQLQRHLYQGLTDGKPVLPPRPRNPALTAATLAMVREQRHLRRCTRHTQRTATRAFLHLFLRAWQSHGQVDDRFVRTEHRCRKQAAASWALQYGQGKIMRQAMWEDKATYTRNMIAQARNDGPAQFAFRLTTHRATLSRPGPPPLPSGRAGPAYGQGPGGRQFRPLFR